MKKYIKSRFSSITCSKNRIGDYERSKLSKLESKLEKIRELARQEELIEPVVDMIVEDYTSRTGLVPTVSPTWSYNNEFDIFSLTIYQHLSQSNYSLTELLKPNQLNPKNKWAISINPSEDEITAYVDNMIDNLNSIVSHTADYIKREYDFTDNEDVVNRLLVAPSTYVDHTKAANYIQSLLNS